MGPILKCHPEYTHEDVAAAANPTDRKLTAIANVRQLNAGGQRLVTEHTQLMIAVHPENEIGALAILELDPTSGRLHFNCPVPPRKSGVPRIGDFLIQAGVHRAHIMGQKHPSGPVVEFSPEELSQFLLQPAVFPSAR